MNNNNMKKIYNNKKNKYKNAKKKKKYIEGCSNFLKLHHNYECKTVLVFCKWQSSS